MTETSDLQAGQPLDWSRLDELSDPQLAALVQSAIFVLKQHEASDSPADMPPGPMTKALAPLFAEEGVDPSAAEQVVKRKELSRPIALALLGLIGADPVLAKEIEQVWRERSGMLIIGTAAILAVSLLLLVLKLKKVRAGRDGLEIDFDRVATGSIGAVAKIVGL
jgi:hypothetical protein